MHSSCDRLDRAPHPSRYFRLPENFGCRFMVFADTEEEFDWSKPQRRDQRSTTHVRRLAEAHGRLRDMGAHTVYLVDHPIATDPMAIDTLRPLMEAGECDVGTQLHPWVNPPFEEEVNLTNTFSGNLPVALEAAKLRCLTETIEEGFGKRPIIYRAGRYGVGPNSAGLLAELGYRIDVSVRAYYDYSSEEGPNFSNVKPLPYKVGNLTEVPLTAAYLGALRGVGPRLFPMTAKLPLVRGAVARASLLNRVSLTPEGVPVEQALRAVERLLEDGHQLFSLSFHSPSIEPGHTPYVRDEADLVEFYDWWEKVLGLLTRRGARSASVSDLLAATADA